MLRHRYVLAGGVIAVLIVANIFNYVFSGWGLITVKVTDAPLSQVIRSIEWQGWVTIYTNLEPDTKISMYVDHVTLPEAMETLAVNAGAQWKLGFFAAPSSGQVKDEIRSFQEGGKDDDLKIYSYPTPMQMLAGEDDLPVADPRLQAWLGVKAPSTPTPAPPPTDGSAPATASDPAAAPEETNYLRDFARGADIWILAPTSWTPTTPAPPAPESSISSAVKRFVGNVHGSVTEALVLQKREPRGQGGRRGGGFAGGDFNWDATADRLRNAINGLPPDARAGALDQLDQETKFHIDLAAAPPDKRGDMMRQHMMAKMMNGDPTKRMSPEKRAQRFARAVANRQAAMGRP
jgi:hypothetical protein